MPWSLRGTRPVSRLEHSCQRHLRRRASAVVSHQFELVGGVEKRDIEIVCYDERWPGRFEEERKRVVAALGGRARRIEHIGSTAVPGLPAKSIIDINLSVDDPDDEAEYLPALKAAGYQLRAREPGHRMVRSPSLDVHVHVCATGSDWETRHVLFRDWLRTHPGDRDLYGQAKAELAQRAWADMNDFADAKTGMISEILGRAKAASAD